MRNRIVFLGSKPIGLFCLNYLIKHQNELDSDVVGVLTNNNNKLGQANLAEVAHENGIEVYENLEQLLDVDYDYLISVQYHQILKDIHIKTAKKLAVNLHMAPLPEYRGCNQFTFAIIDGKDEFGTTLHVMEPGIDSGDILFEKRFSIEKDIVVSDLYDRTFQKSCELFEESIKDILSGEIDPIPQSDFMGSRDSSIHYRKEINEAKIVDLNWSAEKISAHVRGTSMPGFPPPFAIVEGVKINLTIEDKI